MTKFLSFLVTALLALPAFAQVDCNRGMLPLDDSAESTLSPRGFIKVVAAKEEQYFKALDRYGYAVDIEIETLTGDAVDGEFHRASVVDFDAGGARRETVAGGSSNTLKRLKLSAKDIAGLGDPTSFTFDAANFANRDIVYSGRQKMGDSNLIVFDVLPRSAQPLGHAFEGRTWVRGRDTAIARICGRSTDFPIANMRFVSQREQVADGNYFPVVVRADEDAQIGGAPVHVRATVKFSNYRARP